MFLRLVLTAVVALSCINWASTSAFAQDGSAPVDVVLTYTETAPAEAAAPVEKTTCSGGGLLGAMNCVTQRIEEAGSGAGGGSVEVSGPTSTAMLPLTLIAVLRKPEGTGPFEVRVKVRGGSPIFDGDFDDQTKTVIRSDGRLVKEKLKRWHVTLTAEQMATLRRDSSLTVEVVHPFRGLKKLALNGPAQVQVQYTKEENFKLSFFVESALGFIAADGLRVKEGDFFVVEVAFDEIPERTPVIVEIESDGKNGRLSVVLNRVGSSGTVYRSNPLVMDSEGSVIYGLTH